MATSNPPKTKRGRRIYSIFSAGQLDKLLDEIGTAPLPSKWNLHIKDGDWKEYVSASKQLRFRGEISHEEVVKVLGPAHGGNGDNQFMIEAWEFGFSDDKYDYIFCIRISFIDNIAVSGIMYWKKCTREY